MSNTIKLNGVSFNPEVVAKFATAEDFYTHASHQHYWHRESEAERHKRLTFVWELSKDAVPGVSIAMENIQLTNNANTTESNQQPGKAKRVSRGKKRTDSNKGAGGTNTTGATV